MKRLAFIKSSLFSGPAVLTGILALSPQLGWAQRDSAPSTPAGRFSDRDRSVEWNKQKEALQQSLKLGESKDHYRRELEKMGWLITAVNSDKADYVEWEIVKGDQSYEVQIDLDKSNKASKIDVTTNMWKADATKRAMKGNKVPAMGRGDARFSDRDRRAEWTKGEEQLEQALKTGQDKEFYRREIEKMGWTVTSVNSDKPEYAEWEIVKGDQSYEVQIDFDKTSRKATKIDVTTNMWQAEATERAVEANQGGRNPRRSDARSDAGMRDSRSAMTSGEDVRQAQKKLNELGYQTGQVDGVIGPRTEAALRSFQQSKNIAVTGRLDETTTNALGLK